MEKLHTLATSKKALLLHQLRSFGCCMSLLQKANDYESILVRLGIRFMVVLFGTALLFLGSMETRSISPCLLTLDGYIVFSPIIDFFKV